MKIVAHAIRILTSIMLISSLFSLQSCVSIPESNMALSPIFANKDGCFLLYDMDTKIYVDSFNPEFCKRAKPACSTFKIPLAVMAYDSDVLKNENTTFKWNGKKEIIPDWNQDQNATTWMANSVIWFSQRITKTLGRKKIQAYLEAFHYGNRNFSGKIANAWLTPAPFVEGTPKPTLLISPVEQVEFLEKFWTFRLPAKRSAIETAQNISYLEETLKGYQWSGKTGSGFVDIAFTKRLGWFVAHIKGHNKNYIAVLDFEDTVAQEKGGFGGTEAKAMMMKILSSKGLY